MNEILHPFRKPVINLIGGGDVAGQSEFQKGSKGSCVWPSTSSPLFPTHGAAPLRQVSPWRAEEDGGSSNDMVCKFYSVLEP